MDSLHDGASALLAEIARTPDTPVALPFRGTERYVVRRRLGEGAFGVVYEVRDRSSGRPLALKVLKQHSGASIEWLKQEFRSVADLVHENLVALHELVSQDGRWFITMQLVEGVDFLSHAGDGELPRLREALGQLARGVMAIHDAGKLHRDLKPSNVLVDPRGRVVILDFGLARAIEPSDLLTVSRPMAGTPRYMAPEVLAGGDASRASDWYAVGVMLYEALAGQPPHDAGGLHELLALKTDRDPPRPRCDDAGLADLCLALLARDANERASGADVLACLGEATPAATSRAVPRPASEIVGRQDVLERLERRLACALRGEPATIFVHGAPGVGKTTVCQHFLSTMRRRRDLLVLPARCYERESVPYKAVDGVVDALAAVLRRMSRTEAAALMPRDAHLLARLFAVLEDVPALKAVPTRACNVPDPQQLRRRAFAALKELLGRLADKQPLAIFIDDLQWSDVDSARLLAELLAPPDPPALLFVGSYRTAGRQHNPALDALLTDPSGGGREQPTLALGGLSASAAVALAERLAEDLAPADVERAVREAKGHPLFLAELLRARLEHGEGPAPSLSEVIMRRVRRLSREARALLELVSVAGRPLAQRLCLQAAGLELAGVDALRMLTVQNLVRTAGPSERDFVEPYHDRVREAVLEATDGQRRRVRHLALAATLQSDGADAETLVEHYDAGGDAERAGHYARIAADAAHDALAFDRAARLYRLALERLQPVGSDRAALLTQTATALANAGRGGEAGQTFLEAAEHATGDTRDLRRQAAEQLLVSGREREGLEVLEPLLAEVGLSFPKTVGAAVRRMIWTGIKMSLRGMRVRERHGDEVPSELLLRLDVLESAGRGLEFHDLWRSCAFFNEHALLALRAGEPRRAARALPNFVSAYAVPGGINDKARAAAERSLAYAEQHGEHDGIAGAHRNLAISAGYASGLWREAVEHFDRADAVLGEHCAGNMRDLRYCRMKAALALLRLGELRRLAERCDAHLREAVDRGDHLARTALQIYAKAPLLLAADDPDAARRVLGTCELPSTGVFRLYHVCALAEVQLYCGAAAAAVASWQAWWPEFEAAKLALLPMFAMDARRGYALALVAEGSDDALRRASKLAKKLKGAQLQGMAGARESVLGCIAARRGHDEQAQARLARAAEAYDAAEMKLHAAACRRARGVVIGDQELVAAADAVMRDEGIVRPDRWAATSAPIGTRGTELAPMP